MSCTFHWSVIRLNDNQSQVAVCNGSYLGLEVAGADAAAAVTASGAVAVAVGRTVLGGAGALMSPPNQSLQCIVTHDFTTEVLKRKKIFLDIYVIEIKFNNNSNNSNNNNNNKDNISDSLLLKNLLSGTVEQVGLGGRL